MDFTYHRNRKGKRGYCNMTERVTKRGIRNFILICILAMLTGIFVPVKVSAATTYSRTLNSCIVKAKKGRIILAYNPSQTGVPVYARTIWGTGIWRCFSGKYKKTENEQEICMASCIYG